MNADTGLSSGLDPVYTLFAFLGLILVGGVILLAVIARPGSRRGHGGSRRGSSGGSNPASSTIRLDRAGFAARWSTIQTMATQGGGNGLRQAIAEADKLLDQALRQASLPGTTFAERLKSARSRFADYGAYDATWRAHKLRNALAHEVGFDLVPSQAREALGDFERALRTLGAL